MNEDLGIVDALAQLSFLVQGALAKRASAHDVSLVQARLLGILRDRTPTMAQLAAALELDKSSITGLVDRAEARGLVARRPSREDRRAVQVTLTRRGRSLVDTVSKEFDGDVAAMVGSLTLPQQRRLSQLASRVVSDRSAV